MSSSDPGGDPPDLVSLQENFSQQQAKISALKELVRRSEAAQGKHTATAQEKVKNIAQRLTHLKSKASKSRQPDKFIEIKEEIIPNTSDDIQKIEVCNEESSYLAPIPKSRSETPGSEKIQLLRKQMEKNRQKMAEREHSKRGIEELVTQLKAKFDSNQINIEKSQLGRSVGDLSVLSTSVSKERHQSVSDLRGQTFNLDKERIKYLEKRLREMEIEIKNKEFEFLNKDPESEHLKIIKHLENKILDFEESLKEKESIIEARTQAVCLVSEDMSLKGKNTIDMLEDTKQEMFKMQTKFIDTENHLKQEIYSLKDEIDEKNIKIANMNEINDILETTRYDLTIKIAEIENKVGDDHEYSTKLSELNKINTSLQHRIAELEIQKNETDITDFSKEISTKQNETIQDLETNIHDLKTENDNLKKLLHSDGQPATNEDLKDRIRSLEASVQAQVEEIALHLNTIEKLENNLTEKTVEYNVLNANFSVLQEKLKSSAPKSLFSTSTDEEAEAEITKLKTQLDDSNKAMIKMKLKTKQLQKQVDLFKKTSDTNKEIVRLTDQNNMLQQKISILEETKGQFNLHLSDGSSLPDSELEARIKILETTCQNQISAIQLLEEQKIDMTADLNATKQELSLMKKHMKSNDDETIRVSCHMDKIELEEKIEEYIQALTDLKNENVKLNEEKIELSTKLNIYIAENVELLDKLDKLSKGSSAESIEIVESLTHQEKLEMEEFHSLQSRDHQEFIEHQDDNNLMSQDLSESLVKLRDESSELMHKIEMFTNERREVLDKMERLSDENAKYVSQITELTDSNIQHEQQFIKIQNDKIELEKLLHEAKCTSKDVENSCKELAAERNILRDEINNLIKDKNAAINIRQSHTSSELLGEFNLDYCIKSLQSLEVELENYRKSKDKNIKFKKLAKEAKNVHKMMNDLMVAYENCLLEMSNLHTNYEKNKVVNTEHLVQSEFSIVENELSVYKQELEEQKIIAREYKDKNEILRKEKEELVGLAEKEDEIIKNSAITIKELNEAQDRLNEKLLNIEHNLNAEHVKEKNQELTHLRNEFENRLDISNKEIEILKTLVTEQKEQLIGNYVDHESQLEERNKAIENYEILIKTMTIEITNTKEKLSSRDKYVDELHCKIEALKIRYDENNDLLAHQGSELNNQKEKIEMLNQQIMEMYKSMEETSINIIEKEDEIKFLEECLETNKSKMNILNNKCEQNDIIIIRLNSAIEEKTREIYDLKQNYDRVDSSVIFENKILELEGTVKDMTKKNQDQLDKLKKFAANLKKKTAQCNELEEKLSRIESASDSSSCLESIQKEMSHAINDLKLKSKEIMDLQQLLAQKDTELNLLQRENSKMSISLVQSSSNTNEKKYIEERNSLQDQLNILFSQKESMHQYILDLTEQLNQSKLIIQTSTNTINSKDAELENLNSRLNEKVIFTVQLNEEIIKKDTELVLLRSVLREFDTVKLEFATASDDLKKSNLKIEKCKSVLKEKIREIKRLQDNIDEKCEMIRTLEELTATQKDQVTELSEKIKSISDIENFSEKYEKLLEEYTSFRETVDSEMQHTENSFKNAQIASDVKLQENLLLIETIELENVQLKEKISKLEEGIGYIEERRASLEKQSNLLGVELEEKTNEFEQNEDELLRRLNALSGHDEIIEKKLREAQDEKEELLQNLDEIKVEKNQLSAKVGALENKINELQNKLFEIENDNMTLREQTKIMQTELKRQAVEFEKKINEKTNEVNDLENDLSSQLQKIESERRIIQEDLEKSKDQNTELQYDILRYKETITSLDQTNSDMEREMTWLKMQNENMTQDQIEVQELRMQIVHDQTEIENLKAQSQQILHNHDVEINALKKQITELDSLRTQIGQNQTDDQVFIQNENERLQSLLATKEIEIQNYQRQNLQLQMSTLSNVGVSDPFAVIPGESFHGEITKLNEKITHLETKLQNSTNDFIKLQKINLELQNECSMRQKTIAELDEIKNKLSEKINTDLIQLQDLQNICLEKDCEIKKLKDQIDGNIQTIAEELVVTSETDNIYNILTNPDIKLFAQASSHLPNSPHATNSNLPSFNSLNFFGTQSDSTFDKVFAPQISELELDESKTPVVEELIVPKKAYICYPEHNIADIQNDGWEFGSDEAVLEDRHQQLTAPISSVSLVPPDREIEVKLQEYQDRVDELIIERDRLRDDISALKITSGKMLKKLREYKLRNNELSSTQFFRKSSSVESNELDIAIQDELKSQITTLETKIKEAKLEQEKERAEKISLQKKVEVLSVANDRMMEMKEQQDNDMGACKSKIRELSLKLQQLEEWNDNNYVVDNISKTETTAVNVEQIENLKKQILDIRLDYDETQELLDEEKNHSKVLEERIKKLQDSLLSKNDTDQEHLNVVDKLTESISKNENLFIEITNKNLTIETLETKVNQLQAQMEEAISTIDELTKESHNIKINLDQLKEEHKQKIDENSNLSKELQSLSDKNTELSSIIERMKETSLFLNNSEKISSATKELELKIQDYQAMLQYKDAEIVHLNQKVKDVIFEDQTQSLLQEIISKNSEIHNLKIVVQQLENDKTEVENNLSLIKNNNASNMDQYMQTKNDTLDKTIIELRFEKEHMEKELHVLNDQVLNSLALEDEMKNCLLQLDMKNIEISELKNSLEQLKQQKTISQNEDHMYRIQQLETTVATLNNQYEEILEQRCAELADSWRQHLAQREDEFLSIENKLREEILDLQSMTLLDDNQLPSKTDKLSTNPEDELRFVQEMKELLNKQDNEIVSLKEQLAIRSAEYARIAAQIDPFGQMVTSNSMMSIDRRNKPSMELLHSNAGQRSELDIALYVLYQRDMRCEELTEELLHILEERDTLQLKLSNSIRQIEEIKLKREQVEAPHEIDSSDASTTRAFHTTSSIASDESTNLTNLNAKISQLHTTGQSRGKTLLEDRALRQRQMAILQQDLATLPAEAVAELIGADYTSSRTPQSQPSALLNWLRGMGSPKSPDN